MCILWVVSDDSSFIEFKFYSITLSNCIKSNRESSFSRLMADDLKVNVNDKVKILCVAIIVAKRAAAVRN